VAVLTLNLELASPAMPAGRAMAWKRYCMTSIAVSDDSFDNDVLKAEGSVLVDFWAFWWISGPSGAVPAR
jgi:hypothetical protein